MIQAYSAPSVAAGLLNWPVSRAGSASGGSPNGRTCQATMVSAYERDLRQPTLPTLLRLLHAAGFELRMHLAPIEEHDQVLEDLEAGRTHDERQVRDRQLQAWARGGSGGRTLPLREMTSPSLDATAILEVLNRHAVEYVVIGAFAAIAQHAPIPATRDIDLTPSASSENLSRLSAALHELDARIRADGAPVGLPFDHDGPSLGRVQGVEPHLCRRESSISPSSRAPSSEGMKSSRLGRTASTWREPSW